MYKIIYYDTETTGLNCNNDKIIEIAAYDSTTKKSFSKLVNPEIQIPEETKILCNITDDMVKNEKTFEIVGKEFIEFCSPNAILIAHNNDNFDKLFLESEFKKANLIMPKWIFVDSLKWARKYRFDLPKHSLQYLRQIYDIEENEAHRALNDVIILQKVFEKMTDNLPIETVIKLLNKPKQELIEYMPFGKHAGKKLQEIPVSYIKWLQESEIF